MEGRGLKTIFAGALVALFLAFPALASAVPMDRYVDPMGINNAMCGSGSPCATITQALLVADPDETVLVNGGTYDEALYVKDGKSILGVGTDPTVIDSTDPNNPAVWIDPSGAGTISGLTIRSVDQPLKIEGAASIVNDTFDQSGPPSAGPADVFINSAVADAAIDIGPGNTFSDLSPDAQDAVDVFSSAGPVNISGNIFDGFRTAIQVDQGSPTIDNNTIAGEHQSGSAGNGVLVADGGTPTITSNMIHTPNTVPGSEVYGVSLNPGAGATLRGNSILGQESGLLVRGNATAAPITLDGDLIAGSTNHGIDSADTSADDPGVADISVKNVTIADTAAGQAAILGFQNQITLDSSIIGGTSTIQGIDDSAPGGCTITNSRGPSVTGIPGCTNFQTFANPMFVNDAATLGTDDYHLAPGSPMIDHGNPAAPAPGRVDIDGEYRACDGNNDGLIRSDIGADEVVTPASDDCVAPNVTGISGPSKTKSKHPKFKFTASEGIVTYRCKVDHKAYVACRSGAKLKRQKKGHHTLTVIARDQFGNTDQTPRVKKFRIKA